MHTDINTKIKHLVELLNIEPHEIASDILDAADGYDNRMSLLKDLLALTAAVADAVADQNDTDGDCYDVNADDGETDRRDAETADEQRLLAYACYFDGKTARDVSLACTIAERAFDRDRAASDALPCEMTAEEYVAKLASLYA